MGLAAYCQEVFQQASCTSLPVSQGAMKDCILTLDCHRSDGHNQVLELLSSDCSVARSLKRIYLVQSSPIPTLEAALERARALIRSAQADDLAIRVQAFPPNLSATFVRGLRESPLSRSQFSHVLSVVSIDDSFFIGLSPATSKSGQDGGPYLLGIDANRMAEQPAVSRAISCARCCIGVVGARQLPKHLCIVQLM